MVWAAASWYSRATIRTAASIRIPSSTSRLVRGVGSEIGSCYRSLPVAPDDRFGDEDYPAYTMGAAAEMIGVTPDFLRRLDQAKLFTPLRSAGGHRRYSRYQLRLAARAREMVDQGTAMDAACRIIILEDQLEEALRLNDHAQRGDTSP